MPTRGRSTFASAVAGISIITRQTVDALGTMLAALVDDRRSFSLTTIPGVERDAEYIAEAIHVRAREAAMRRDTKARYAPNVSMTAP